MDRTKTLIALLLSHPDTCESDGVAYELLTEYQRGSRIDSLRILLSSSDDRLVGEGAWVASELGVAGKSLIQEVRALLSHHSKKVRFWALDCALLWADASNGIELASAVGLIDDTEEAVRWKTMGFLSMASAEQLRAALEELRTTRPGSSCIDDLNCLLDSRSVARIKIELKSDDARRRRFAAAAAFRVARTDPEALQYAASSADPEVAHFAQDMLKTLS